MNLDEESDDDVYYVNIKGNYCKRRIEQWSINTDTNQIFGYVHTCPDCVVKVNNVILSYVDSYVLVRIGPHNYALILGEINPLFGNNWTEYMKYLRRKAPKPFIQV